MKHENFLQPKPCSRVLPTKAALLFLVVVGLASPSYAVELKSCFSNARNALSASPAFKVACTAPTDCEFEPSIAMNASAMVRINSLAEGLKSCWQNGGLVVQKKVDVPQGMKVLVHRYMPRRVVKGASVCTIAELKPFGAQSLTSSFRAQCRTK